MKSKDMRNTEMTDKKEEEDKKKDEGKVTFEEMNLQVGTRMQLITYGTKKNEYYTSLIGFEPGRYVFIRMPQENGFNVPLKIAERVEVRIFTGVSIFIFPSCVEYIYQTPRNFVELAFPDVIRAMPLRKDIRITVKMPVKIWFLHGQKLEDSHIVTALDLSITGVMLQGDINPGEVGDEVGISFSIRNTVTDENTLIEVMATIKNSRKEEDESGNIIYKNGVLFKELRPFHRATLQNFINDYILLGRQTAAQQLAG